MAKFCKKPVVIDAIRITKEETIHTLEGNMIAADRDWETRLTPN